MPTSRDVKIMRDENERRGEGPSQRTLISEPFRRLPFRSTRPGAEEGASWRDQRSCGALREHDSHIVFDV